MQRNDDAGERATVSGDKTSLPPPIPTKAEKAEQVEPPLSPVSVSTIKRRSLSVGQNDFGTITASSKSAHSPHQAIETIRPSTRGSDDSALHGILDEFRGQLSQLSDPVQGSLDLHDPSTPARQLAYRQKQGRTATLPVERPLGPRPDSHKSSATSSIASKPSSPEISDVFSTPPPQSVLIPPRSSSLQTPMRTPLSSGGPPNSRLNSTRLGVSTLRSQTSPVGLLSPQVRDGGRLRVLHRSTASSSEPSLIPEQDVRMSKSNIFPLAMQDND